VEDGFQLEPNQPFVKIWRIRNTGNTPWPQGITLAWVSGDSLSSVGDSVPVMAVMAGGEVDVSVPMQAPAEPGRFVSNWQLRSPSGIFFGRRVWADIVVKDTTGKPISAGQLDETPINNSTTEMDIDAEWSRQSCKVRKINKINKVIHAAEEGNEDFVASNDVEPSTELLENGEQEAEPTRHATSEEHSDAEQVTDDQTCTRRKDPIQVGELLPRENGACCEDDWEVMKAEGNNTWASELAVLREMEIGDLDSMRRALAQTNGDLQLAAQSLLGEQSSAK